MMIYSNSQSFREAGSLINRPVTFRTIPRFWHSRTGITAFLLLLSTTTELVVLNLIPQHDPQPDPQLACHGHARFPQTLLHQFAAVESLQLRILAGGVRSRLTPEKPQPRGTLFAQPTEPLSLSTGILAWNRRQPYRRKAIFRQQLQNQFRISPIMFLL